MSDKSMSVNKQDDKNNKQVEDAYLQGEYELNEFNSDIIMDTLDRTINSVYGLYRQNICELYDVKKNKRESRICAFEIERWVIDSEEDNVKKFSNVFNSFSNENCRIALIISKTASSEPFKVRIAIATDKEEDPTVNSRYGNRLESVIKGNYPGTRLKSDNSKKILGIEKEDCNCIVSFSNLPSEKSKEFVSQRIEKLLDSYTRRENFTIVFIAEPEKVENVKEKLLYLFQRYNDLSPYAEVQRSFNLTTMKTASYSYSVTDTLGMTGTIGGTSGVPGVFGSGSLSYSRSWSRTSAIARAAGGTRGASSTFTDFTIKNTLQNIEKQINRLELALALGLWNFSGYVLSKNPSDAQNIANSYIAMTQGNNSFLYVPAVNSWGVYSNSADVSDIYDYLENLEHPIFSLKTNKEDLLTGYPQIIIPTISLSGEELTYSMNLPQRSIMGLSVVEATPFGRNINKLTLLEDNSEVEDDRDRNDAVGKKDKADCCENSAVMVGNIVHMYETIHSDVKLDLNSLTAHTFITGSTGTGKTTAVLTLLDEARSKGVHFLVVEPAKGEYKNKIGGECKVFGTNGDVTDDVLKINPFWFSEKIHVLEHIDRLIEILNACWPMYAAMPAVLKEAIERAYEEKGWDLVQSKNVKGDFPTFYDLLEILPNVINESMYSDDTKSDYIGALVTRVRSLTNGLNGTVLCAKEVNTEKELFEKNVIIDLSRIGSVETKSLIMGFVIMKLQEYWIHVGEESKKLKHITVLEEAHNLLKRTSFVQSQENSNLQGKSVEMITNAIAEMRAYGEGFIIADQAPMLLDEAVIRNTNTKIVFRLPDAEDRLITGKACSLTEKQINEIGKLPNHTAVVYQNDWLEAVLCSIKKNDTGNKYQKKSHSNTPSATPKKTAEYFIKYLFDENSKLELSDEDRINALRWVDTLRIDDDVKRMMQKAFSSDKGEISRMELAYNLFDGKTFAQDVWGIRNENLRVEYAKQRIKNKYRLNDDVLALDIYRYIISGIYSLLPENSALKKELKGSIERKNIK